MTAALVRPIPGAHLTRAPCKIPTAAEDEIVRAKASNTTRFGLIDRSDIGAIDFGVVGPKRAKRLRSRV